MHVGDALSAVALDDTKPLRYRGFRGGIADIQRHHERIHFAGVATFREQPIQSGRRQYVIEPVHGDLLMLVVPLLDNANLLFKRH